MESKKIHPPTYESAYGILRVKIKSNIFRVAKDREEWLGNVAANKGTYEFRVGVSAIANVVTLTTIIAGLGGKL